MLPYPAAPAVQHTQHSGWWLMQCKCKPIQCSHEASMGVQMLCWATNTYTRAHTMLKIHNLHHTAAQQLIHKQQTPQNTSSIGELRYSTHLPVHQRTKTKQTQHTTSIPAACSCQHLKTFTQMPKPATAPHDAPLIRHPYTHVMLRHTCVAAPSARRVRTV